MNTIKQFLLALLVALASNISALAYDFEVDGIYYNIISYEELTCEVTRNPTWYIGDIVIPASVTYSEKTYNVTTIGDYAFNSCTSLTTVEIPNSVTTIGQTAFGRCDSLQSFTGKFSSEDNRCLIVDGTLNSFAPAGLTSYSIPNSVTTIGDYAFADCRRLTTVEIPNSVTTIGDYAFADCRRLTTVEIPNSVTTIGDYAFHFCASLTTVEIPNSVTTIGAGAFNYCTCLESFTGKFSSEDNRFLIVCGTIIAFAPAGLISYSIPNSVTTIGYLAFTGCSNLTAIEIPNSVTTIEICAFYGCTSLTEVEIPNSVTTLDGEAFRKCTSLTAVEIPNSVTLIGALAFCECTSLTAVEIPNSVTEIGRCAFYGCTSLSEIVSLNTIPPTVEGNCFLYVPTSTCVLKVPAESVELYKAADGWKDFKNIEGLLAVKVENMKNDDWSNDKAYDLHGKRVGDDYKGIVIRKGKKFAANRL